MTVRHVHLIINIFILLLLHLRSLTPSCKYNLSTESFSAQLLPFKLIPLMCLEGEIIKFCVLFSIISENYPEATFCVNGILLRNFFLHFSWSFLVAVSLAMEPVKTGNDQERSSSFQQFQLPHSSFGNVIVSCKRMWLVLNNARENLLHIVKTRIRFVVLFWLKDQSVQSSEHFSFPSF